MLRSILQNSTAGFYVFASDSTTPTTGKTGLTLTVTLSKNGGTANAVSPTITEIGDGSYWVAPIAAHRDTLGEIAWHFAASGAVIAPRYEKVVAVNDQVAAFGANTTAPANSTISSIYSVLQLTDADVATLLTRIIGTLASGTHNPQSGDAFARLGAPAGASIAADIAAIDGGGGAGDAEQETLLEVLEKVDAFSVGLAGSSPVEPTGDSETVMARLTRIEAATGSILGGRVLRSAGPVTPAGDISLVVGSDYVEDIDGSLLRSFSDPGASVHTKLTAGALSQLVFSAAEKPSDPTTKRIAGTVTEVSEADGVTSVRIEILRTAIPVGPYSADWKYHIWREADNLVSPPLLEGCLTLEWRA